MEFWNERKQVARVEHRCDACGKTIEVGQKYSYMASKAEGEFWVLKQHAECREAEVGIAIEYGLAGGEEWMFLNDLQEPDDLAWIQENHPAAFERIKDLYLHWSEKSP